MSSQSKKIAIVLVVVVIFLTVYYRLNVCECVDRITYNNLNANEDINLDSLFHPVDTTEVAKTLSDWNHFDPKSDSVNTVGEFNSIGGRKLSVVEHFANGAKHYGAIVLPLNYRQSEKYPILLWANGLSQFNPSVDVNRRAEIRKLVLQLGNYFLIIPSFRGQALVVEDNRYCSDGFFGDAYDGATDDALRLLHLVRTQYQNIDSQRMAVYGVSRGGTVALLMGIRNPEFNCVISQAGPTDFLLKGAYAKHGLQFKYQFLSERLPISLLRAKIIRSSPINFVHEYPNKLLLIYGEKDEIVPIVNATNLVHKARWSDKLEFVSLKTGHNFDYTKHVVDWLKRNN